MRQAAKKHKKITRSESYLINAKYIGDEPLFDISIPLTSKQYGDAFNWYNYMCSVDDARQYIIDYLSFLEREKDLSLLRKVSDVHINLTSGWIARLLMNRYITPDGSMEFFEKKLKETLSHVKYESVVLNFNIQDRIRDKKNELIGHIENKIDDHSFCLYDYLKKNNTPPSYCADIITKYSEILAEIIEADEGKDDQLTEAYSYMSQKQITDRIIFLNNLISDAEKYSSNVKKTRAPSKPRPVKVETLLKTFKYQKEDKELKIASIQPSKILGAQELWTYNTKYKTLFVYKAVGPKGLSIKGTSIINYDEKTSVGKSTGRKNKEYLHRVMNDGKVKLRKIFDDITTANVFTNRIGENTILLKIN